MAAMLIIQRRSMSANPVPARPTSEPLWRPDKERVARAKLTAFRRMLASRLGDSESMSYAELWKYSIDRREEFWSALWDFCDVRGSKGDVICLHREKMPGAGWF